ncbi:MAG: hypothetical protein IT331_23290 [Anaerolineae bacterium]|nr:hypothetical protein [Anaerolineae bacterium]
MNLNDSHGAWKFTPTKWHSIADKDKFARHYIKFVQARCPFEKFHEWFYSRLMHMFMHIAHYNRFAFHAIWCDAPEKRLALLHHHREYACAGDPEWTWSDVERTLQAWIAESGILREYEFEAAVTRHQTTLAVAKAALNELTDEDVSRLVQERSAPVLSVNGNGETAARANVSPRGEQQALFQI